MINILLTSDIHLGIGDKSPVPERFRLTTFKRICHIAKSHDLFLISGDLFNDFNIKKEILDIVSDEFKEISSKGTDVLYLPGESERGANGYPAYLSRLNAKFVFSDINNFSVYSCVIKGSPVFVYGIPAISNVDIRDLRRKEEKGFHVALFHTGFKPGAVSSNSRIISIDKRDIKMMGMDFYALGHYHQFRLLKTLGRVIGAYTGSPEATSLNEKGERYVLSLSVEGNEILQIKRLSVNTAMVKETVIDCTALTDSSSVAEAVSVNKSSGTIHRIKLVGRRNFRLAADITENAKNDYLALLLEDLSIQDIPSLIKEFKEEESLRGEFFNVLEERLQNGNVPIGVNVDAFSEHLSSLIKTGDGSKEEKCLYDNA